METNKELLASLEATRKQIDAQIEQLKKQSNEPKFEVGKWYKSLQDSFRIINFKGIGSYNFGYCEVIGWHEDFQMTDVSKWKPATDKEVEEALIKEAEKKIGINNYFICLEGKKRKITDKRMSWRTERYHNFGTLYVDGHEFFTDGKWAEIVKDEPIKIGGYEVVKKEDLGIFYEIGCKSIIKSELQQIKDFMQRSEFYKVSFDGIETDLETINKILSL